MQKLLDGYLSTYIRFQLTCKKTSEVLAWINQLAHYISINREDVRRFLYIIISSKKENIC